MGGKEKGQTVKLENYMGSLKGGGDPIFVMERGGKALRSAPPKVTGQNGVEKQKIYWDTGKGPGKAIFPRT